MTIIEFPRANKRRIFDSRCNTDLGSPATARAIPNFTTTKLLLEPEEHTIDFRLKKPDGTDEELGRVIRSYTQGRTLALRRGDETYAITEDPIHIYRQLAIAANDLATPEHPVIIKDAALLQPYNAILPANTTTPLTEDPIRRMDNILCSYGEGLIPYHEIEVPR